MENQKGFIIDQACQILVKTYKEIGRLKDDLAELLIEYEPSMQFVDQYSGGSTSLFLKPNHTYLFKRKLDESEAALKEERVLAVTCIFYDADIPRVNLKDQPELWVGLFDIKNSKQDSRPWDISYILKPDERDHFTNKELRIGGDVFEYLWINNKTPQTEREEWRGEFVGYPLVDITSLEDLKAKIMEKLFKAF